MNGNLYHLYASRFSSQPENIAIESDNGELISYGDLDLRVAKMARFITDLGVSAGDRVTVQVDKSAQALILYLACIRAGCIYLPLNTAYQSRELEYFLKDAEPSMMVCRPDDFVSLQKLCQSHGIQHLFTLDAEGAGSLSDASQHAIAGFETVRSKDDDIACILYTSGTTGHPKGAMITHHNLASNGLKLHQAWGFEAGDVLLHALPVFHVHGIFVACGTAILNASRMIFLSKFDAKTVIARLPEATVFMGVPTFYVRLLAEPDFGRDVCRNIRLFTAGSAPLLAQTFEEFEQRTGHTIVERYGMTETEMSTSNPYLGERKCGTVGPPLPGIEVKVVDAEGKECTSGDNGELLVKGDNVFKGYWRKPEKTAEDFDENGWFKTGDIASIGEDGYVRISGRSKDLIISGGYNVYPKEIEICIDEIDGIAESAVIGVDDADFGETVTAIVVRAESGNDVDEAAVIAHVKSQLANFKVPKKVFFVDGLPRNTMGKVQKNILREQFNTRV